MKRLSRRSLLAGFAGGSLALGLTPRRAFAAEDRVEPHMIVRLDRPYQLETPAPVLELAYTPNDQFFVRSHFDPPARDLFAPRFVINGAVAKPLDLTLDAIRAMESVELPAVLQCAGNGRALHPKRVPGVQWEKGAVGQAKWRGVRLANLLEKAGLDKTVAHLTVRGCDTPPNPNTPAFVRSMPIARALDPTTLVCFAMNGEPLPHLHGGPMRLVVPGWGGNFWTKWICELTASAEPAKGFFMETGYQMPVEPGSETYAPLAAMPVKSLITRPMDRQEIGRERREVSGHAFSGHGAVTQVELSADGGKTWAKAELEKLESPGAWQRFTYAWTPAASGPFELISRATDASGAVQPEVTPPNRSGYFWNGWDRVKGTVRA